MSDVLFHAEYYLETGLFAPEIQESTVPVSVLS